MQHDKLTSGEQISEFFRGEQGVYMRGVAPIKSSTAVAAFTAINAQTQVGDGAEPLFEGFVVFGRR